MHACPFYFIYIVYIAKHILFLFMRYYKSFRSCGTALHSKYGAEAWFGETLGYLQLRYHPIEARIIDTFRYVELAPRNKSTFSYEYGSIIRDIGSVFASVLDRFVRSTHGKGDYDIMDYRNFLADEITDIELIAAQLRTPFTSNFVLPFEEIRDTKSRLDWWDAYNNLKHSDIENFQDGCLTNVVYGMTSLAILYSLMATLPIREQLFSLIGYFKPIDAIKKYSFPKC